MKNTNNKTLLTAGARRVFLMLILLAGVLVASRIVGESAPEHDASQWGLISGVSLSAIVAGITFGSLQLRTPHPARAAQKRILAKAHAQACEPKKELMAEDFLYDDLLALGMDPVQDENEIMFRFQGGYFRAVALDHRVIKIIYPRIFRTDVENQNLLSRVLNKVNGSFALVKLTSVPAIEDNDLYVHGFADMLYTSAVSNRGELLSGLLQIFFDAQHALAMAYNAAYESVDFDGIEANIAAEDQDMCLN